MQEEPIIPINQIIQGIKYLTSEERKVLEKELVIMRLSEEFKSISDNIKKRREAKNE